MFKRLDLIIKNRQLQKEIKRLKSQCEFLVGKLKDRNLENNKLKKIRILDARNNTKIQEQNNKKTELINNVIKALYCNVKTDTQKIEKIKELISDFDSQN